MKSIKEETMGMRIKKLRIAMGYTQEELATRLLTKKMTISAYENDRIDIKISILKEIARILRTSISYLAEGEVYELSKEALQIAVLLQGIKREEIKETAIKQVQMMAAMDEKIQ